METTGKAAPSSDHSQQCPSTIAQKACTQIGPQIRRPACLTKAVRRPPGRMTCTHDLQTMLYTVIPRPNQRLLHNKASPAVGICSSHNRVLRSIRQRILLYNNPNRPTFADLHSLMVDSTKPRMPTRSTTRAVISITMITKIYHLIVFAMAFHLLHQSRRCQTSSSINTPHHRPVIPTAK